MWISHGLPTKEAMTIAARQQVMGLGIFIITEFYSVQCQRKEGVR